jgi:protein ImuB
MSLPGKRRAAPGVPPLPATAHERPGLRPALGGGRGAGESAAAVATGHELWLAIHLPHYVLESLRWRAAAPGSASGHDTGMATVVVDLEGGGKVVCDLDADAAAAGITRGMALNSALALLPGLHVLARDVPGERALLEAVAACANGFTPRVALEPPDGVLLEVRGSLRLFGGVRRLFLALRAQLQSLGLEPRIALAPTPLASLWFARSGAEVALRRRDSLASRLGPLPLACTRWPEKSIQSLATMGARTIGDCLRLPRDGFARRFEPEMLCALDRAMGRVHDPRAAFVHRERYAARRDLEPEISDVERLGRAIAPLVVELCSFLRLRGGGVDVLDVRLVHRDAKPTRLRLRFLQPVAQAERITGSMQERLVCTVLPEPVRAVRLRSGPLLEVREESGDLFARDQRRAAGVPQLIERLRARLGAEAVHGICLVPEHRPEAAWKKWGHSPFSEKRGHSPFFFFPLEADGKKENVPVFPRPLWLLAEPQPLEGREQPRYEGPLEIEDGPERIESGWWDGRDVRRDYYVARTRTGARLWVFRERRAERRWFLHGVFG